RCLSDPSSSHRYPPFPGFAWHTVRRPEGCSRSEQARRDEREARVRRAERRRREPGGRLPRRGEAAAGERPDHPRPRSSNDIAHRDRRRPHFVSWPGSAVSVVVLGDRALPRRGSVVRLASRMLVATWNVNGIRARFGEVTAWSDRVAPDVFCLQEIKAAPSQIPEPLTGLPAYVSHWHGAATGYSGVSLHVKRGAFAETPRFEHPSFDEENRIAVVRLGDLVVASVYVHNGGKALEPKLRFLEALAHWAGERQAAGD